MPTPKETISKKVEEGLAWLRESANAAVGAHIGDKELLDAWRQSVIKLSYELEDKWSDLVERGKGKVEKAPNDQLELPNISGQRCNVLADKVECCPDPTRPECRMYCGVWPAGLPAKQPDVSWLTACTLVLDVSPYDPETGEVIEEESVVYHKPAMLGPAPVPCSESAELEPDDENLEDHDSELEAELEAEFYDEEGMRDLDPIPPRDQVIDFLRGMTAGATDKEIAEGTKMSSDVVAINRIDLVREGVVKEYCHKHTGKTVTKWWVLSDDQNDKESPPEPGFEKYEDKSGNVYKVIENDGYWQAWKHKPGYQGRLVPTKVAPTSRAYCDRAPAQAELVEISERKGWALVVENEEDDQSKTRPAKKRGNGWA